MFALVDVNNFYASCERLFKPHLKTLPVVVLSNNDGCIVARSAQAKSLGIKMGVPIFKVKEIIKAHNVQVFSSNYALYGDISARVMSTLEALAPRVEVYSIDEAFLGLKGMEKNIGLQTFGERVKTVIDTHIGVPVCVGIAQTKTLAKLANHAAKKYPATQGVVTLTDPKRQRKLMGLVAAGDIWGIGRRLGKRLASHGIHTALDFANAPESFMRKMGSVVLARTHAELNGMVSYEIESAPPPKKQIVCSRSFSQKITQLEPLREAIGQYTSRALEKLRLEGQSAKAITVFIRTSPYNRKRPYYSNAATAELRYPSHDTRIFLREARQLLDALWKPDCEYAKAGVMLSDFSTNSCIQMDMFDPVVPDGKGKLLMDTIDKINHSGLGKVFFASQGIEQVWKMNRQFLSPCYTTRWSDLPIVT